MNDSLLSWILILEIVLPFLILSIVLIVMLMKGSSRYKEAMRELIINVKDNEDSQKQSLSKFLKENLGLSEEDADTHIKELIKERKFFFRSFVSSILNKDVESLSLMDEELSRLTEKYHKITPGNVSAGVEEDIEDNSDDLQSEIERKNTQIEELKSESKSLKQEVHVTLTTLNNIFAEYSSMFGEEVEQKNLSVEQILTAMESFAGKSASSADDAEEPVEASVDEAPADEAPVDADEEIEADMAVAEDPDSPDDLELSDEPEDESSLLDDMPLESTDDDEPSWDEAFAEMDDDNKDS
ncbi:hypothetical protein [Pleionea sp. CnH1-48]|uniref:hypothetical protein n=1 Tax=Pleionea sp. CnH1-48 TaxID=2954494 RepID=UPI0020982004|nr:hypothetical protein [Pleionea sp. CnH1-48]MCO7227271.1 hypothetical protein [Pleionea sp. CnH1-48]